MVVFLDNGCCLNVISKCIEFIVIMRVVFLCSNIVNYSGNVLKRVGIVDFKIDITASAMFCRKVCCVCLVMENSFGN